VSSFEKITTFNNGKTTFKNYFDKKNKIEKKTKNEYVVVNLMKIKTAF
jgi:hypothetical protein